MAVSAAAESVSSPLKTFNMKSLQDVVEDQVLQYYPEMKDNKLRSSNKKQQVDKFIDESSVPKVLRRSSSFENIYLNKNERRVCVIYTGTCFHHVKAVSKYLKKSFSQ